MRALVRPTSRRLDEGQLTHLDRVPVDVDLAETQWAAYCDTLDTWGFETVRVPGDDSLPDSVFVEDAVVIFGELAVLTSPGAETRRRETDAVAGSLRTLGIEHAVIELPGTLDGGDVLKIGSTIYVGQGGRTNAAGIEQLREAFAPLGADVRAVPVRKVLHLKSAVTALPDGTVIGYEPLVDDLSAFDSFRSVPEEAGAHVVLLGEDRLLMAASAPRSAELFAELGYMPVVVDISEFEKLEGCVTCLSVRHRP
jgi:dimethylargininase